MKAKVLFGADVSGLELAISGWLQNANVSEIVSVSQTPFRNYRTGEDGVVLTIFYR